MAKIDRAKKVNWTVKNWDRLIEYILITLRTFKGSKNRKVSFKEKIIGSENNPIKIIYGKNLLKKKAKIEKKKFAF